MERYKEDRFAPEQIAGLLASLDGWSYESASSSISKTYVRSNFLDAAAFIQQIAGVAEAMDHHPDLHLTSYKNLQVVLTTHSAGGVTQNDIDLARTIDKLSS